MSVHSRTGYIPAMGACNTWRIQMTGAVVPAFSRASNAEPIPLFIWPLVVATTAAVLLLIVYWFGLSNLDRLVPDGTTFLPYYTT